MKIGVIGYGNLACALLSGLTERGNFNKNDVTITAKTEETLSLACLNGLNATDNLAEIFASDLVILAVKPAVYKTLLPQISANYSGKIVSAMACYSLSELKTDFKNASVIRIMPSLLSSSGNDLIAVTGDTENFSDFLSYLTGAGEVIITSEEKFNAYLVALSCGVGFSSYIVECYKNSLEKLGFSLEESNKITKVLFTAAANNNNRKQLYNKVATKGGVTEKGLSEFKNKNLYDAIESGIITAYNMVKK